MAEKFKREKLSFLRRMVIASASITRKKNSIHSFTEIDISLPLKLIDEYKKSKNEKLSFTGYLVACLAKVIRLYPKFNSFIKGNKLIILKDINISVLMERKIGDEYVPEPLMIKSCQEKEYPEIHREIRSAQKLQNDKFGSLSDFTAIKYIPKFLLKFFVSAADKNITMAVKYGKLAVTSVGMFSREPVWFIPHGSATVLLTVGSIIERVVLINKKVEKRKYLCLTVSFDHDIIDGAPASRFMNDLIIEIKSGKIIKDCAAGAAV